MAYYSRIEPGHPLFLLETRKPAVVICLRGDILVLKNASETKNKKHKKGITEEGQFIKFR